MAELHTLCECGCGLPTLDKERPRRFRAYHYKRPMTVAPYKRMEVDGKIQLAHRVRAEQALGHPLPPKAQVHHADGTTDLTAPLVICPDFAYHRLLHIRTNIYRAGGDPNRDRICSRCRVPKNLEREFTVKRRQYAGRSPYCRDCERLLMRARRARKAAASA